MKGVGWILRNQICTAKSVTCGSCRWKHGNGIRLPQPNTEIRLGEFFTGVVGFIVWFLKWMNVMPGDLNADEQTVILRVGQCITCELRSGRLNYFCFFYIAKVYHYGHNVTWC